MNLRTLCTLIFTCVFLSASSQAVEVTLYMNKGTITVSDDSEVPYYAYNLGDSFELQSEIIEIDEGQSLNLTVINNTSESHGMTLQQGGVPVVLLSGESTTFEMDNPVAGVYRFYDHTFQLNYSYLGLGSAVVVRSEADSHFVWNFRTHRAQWNTTIDEGGAVDWDLYKPDYYTVNNLSFPAINDDPMANLNGSVGDVIHVHLVNSGPSVHSIHFHGYHCEMVSTTRDTYLVGSVKDTFPLWPGESMTLELVPHQPGIYPVHDHNLTAIGGGGIYLNGGALIMIDIQQ